MNELRSAQTDADRRIPRFMKEFENKLEQVSQVNFENRNKWQKTVQNMQTKMKEFDELHSKTEKDVKYLKGVTYDCMQQIQTKLPRADVIQFDLKIATLPTLKQFELQKQETLEFTQRSEKEFAIQKEEHQFELKKQTEII